MDSWFHGFMDSWVHGFMSHLFLFSGAIADSLNGCRIVTGCQILRHLNTLFSEKIGVSSQIGDLAVFVCFVTSGFCLSVFLSVTPHFLETSLARYAICVKATCEVEEVHVL